MELEASKDRTYMFGGDSIYAFQTGNKIEKYASIVCGNGVPYPFAYEELKVTLTFIKKCFHIIKLMKDTL